MNLYNEILNQFTGDGYREWMHKPFIIGDKAYATDAHIMVIVPKDKVTGINQFTGKDPAMVLDVIPSERNINSPIKLKTFKEAIETAPLDDEMKETRTQCEECDGSGEVEWDYERWTKEFYCPVCGGDGYAYEETPTGKKTLSENGYIKIGDCYFRITMISKIAKVAEVLAVDEVVFIFQKESKTCNIIQIKDLEMLLMPCSISAVDEDVKEGKAAIITEISL